MNYKVDVGAVLERLIDRANDGCRGEDPGDYYDDSNLLVCGKCHTNKQTAITTFNGEARVVRCVCRCEDERRKKQRADEEAAEQIAKLRESGIHDQALAKWTFEADDGSNQKMKTARKYVDNWETCLAENIGLVLSGSVGTGKTFMAACIANYLLDQRVPVLMTSFPRIINKLSTFKEDTNTFLKSLNRYKLLIIDDLGVERQSDFVMEQVYQIVDERYKSGLPMIVTTNIPLEELRHPQDVRFSRIYDRILENCMPVQVIGESRRGEKRANKMHKARALFG